MVRNMKIGSKIIVIATVSAAIALFLAAVAVYSLALKQQVGKSQVSLVALAELVGHNAVPALRADDAAMAQEVLSTLRANPVVERACLYRMRDNTLFARYEQAGTALPPCQQERADYQGGGEDFLEARAEVPGDGVWYGELQLTQTLAVERADLRRRLHLALAVLSTAIVLMILLLMRLQRVVTGPILRLADVARQVSETSDFSLRAKKTSGDEVGQLTDDFNQMLGHVERSNTALTSAKAELFDRVSETRQANAELEAAMAQLRDAQGQLVQTEKMAALGGLVAGVAHEINTPVGVGVTAASTLRGQAETIKQAFDSGQVRKSALADFLDVATTSSQIILSNLQRAAELVQSFKQVAVDQSSSERRSFDLQEYLDEVLMSLTPKLKRTAHQVAADVEPGLIMDSFPGALAQVITNLLGNALMHAFRDDKPGTITISGRADNDTAVWLVFADDGAGMSEQHVRQVFEPFFTTKRGEGGSGLGMHIVFNLITQVLGGTVDVHSAPGAGTRIVMHLPRVSPGAPAEAGGDAR